MKSNKDTDTDDVERQFERDFARMNHPVFKWLSKLLEWRVPRRDGFGKFRAGTNSTKEIDDKEI